MRTIETKIYTFHELSIEAKEKAIEEYYEKEEYYFLSDELTENCKVYLKEYGCNYSDIKLYYSFAYCQGDGLSFVGEIQKNGITLKLKNMSFYDVNGEVVEDNKELSDIYFDVCKKLKKDGYAIIEYRMDNEEFSELSDANGYEYLENGKRI